MRRGACAAERAAAILQAMWNEPYLETCCRSALHRLMLCGPAGRPDGAQAALKDERCLERLAELGFAAHEGGRFRVTDAGRLRHASEIGAAA